MAEPRRFVHAGGVRTAYLDSGAGEPIVALHGIPTSSELFEPLLPWLDGFRLVAPDLLGQGETEVPRRGRLGHAEYAAHLAAFLDTVAPPTFHLMVHDFGGVLGLPWAAAHPERLRTLLVLSTTASFTLRWWVLCRWMWAAELLGGAKAIRRAIVQTLRRPGSVPAALVDRWARPWTRQRVLRGRDHFARRHLHPVTAALGRIDVPALVLWGKLDRVFPPRYGRRIAKRLPRGVSDTVAGAGHWMPIDRPEATGEAISTFLRAARTSTAAGARVPLRFRPPTSS